MESTNNEEIKNKTDYEISTETYLVLALESNLTYELMEHMSIGMVIDHITEYQNLKNPDNKKNEKVVQYGDEVPWF